MLTPTVWILFIRLCNNVKGLQNIKDAGLFKVCMFVWLHGFITHFMIITSHSSSKKRECQLQLTHSKLSDILVSSLSGLERWFRHAPQGLNFCRHHPGKLQSDRLILSMPVHENESARCVIAPVEECRAGISLLKSRWVMCAAFCTLWGGFSPAACYTRKGKFALCVDLISPVLSGVCVQDMTQAECREMLSTSRAAPLELL